MPENYAELREALENFRSRYSAYLEALRNGDRRDLTQRLRREYNQFLPEAHQAMIFAKRDPSISPPPGIGGSTRWGLRDCVAGIEQWDADPQFLFDYIDQAIAVLRKVEEQEAQREPQRRNKRAMEPAPADYRAQEKPSSTPVSTERRTFRDLDRAQKLVGLAVGCLSLGGALLAAIKWLV